MMIYPATARPFRPLSRPIGYRIYGLRLKSDLPLACTPRAGAGHADIELYRARPVAPGRIPPTRPSGSGADDWFSQTVLDNGSLRIRWSRLFEFLISPDGRRLGWQALDAATQESFQTYLVTQALSCALVKQGIEPLHATVAVVNGTAVAFLGNCGYGKSSLGAAFLKAGHPLLTDDLLVISGSGSASDPLLAQPGPPRLKLFPAVAHRLLGGRRNGARLNPDTKKLILPLSRSEHCPTAVPLAAVYALRPPFPRQSSRSITIRTLPTRKACMALIAGTFNLIITDRARLARQFEWAARMAASVPVKSLSYPRHLGRIHKVVEAVRRDLDR